MAISYECDTHCTVIDHPGGGRGYDGPPEYCNGDPVPHSDLCEQHGGESDLEAFLDDWPSWNDNSDDLCDCIIGHEGGQKQAEDRIHDYHQSLTSAS